MKRFTAKATTAAFALVLTAWAAPAQTMKAEIPFAFRLGKQVMRPGEYLVRVMPSVSSTALVMLASADTGKTTVAVPSNRTAPPREWAVAHLAKVSFACSANSCELAQLWIGDGDTYNFSCNHDKEGDTRVTELTLRPERD